MRVPNLFLHGRTYWVRVSVPPLLVKPLGVGREVKRSLRTHDLATAVTRRDDAVASIKAAFSLAQRGNFLAARQALWGWQDPAETNLTQRAIATRADLASIAESSPELAEMLLAMAKENVVGPPLGHGQNGEPYYDHASLKAAQAFEEIASGKATPISALLDEWLDLSPVAARTKVKRRRELERFCAWLEEGGGLATVERVTAKVAGKYVNGVLIGETKRAGREPKAQTVNSAVSALSTFWQWLNDQGHAEQQPWARKRMKQRAEHQRDEDTRARPWTDDELAKLLTVGPQLMRDLVRFAALTGMRQSEIACLRVEDVARLDDGLWVTIRRAKTKAGRRRVPIHPDLVQLIEGRCDGKAGDAPLFDDIRKKRKQFEERGASVATEFAALIRTHELADIPAGERQSRTNFHSLRRWFVTKAEQAGQPPHVIASVVGHSRQGLTLGLYSGGPSDQQLRACVEAVKLPSGARRASATEAKPAGESTRAGKKQTAR